MAIVVLTSDEKAILRESTRFREQVKFALMNHAEFLQGQDQTGTATQAARELWAKQRYIGTNRFLNDPNQINIARFVEMALNDVKNTPVRDNQAGAFENAVINQTIDYMIAQSTFETLALDAFNFEAQTVLF